MKRIAGIIVLLGLLTVTAGDALAQFEEPEEEYLRLPHRFHVFLDGGIAVPAQPGEFKDYWNAALPFTIGVGAPVFSWFDLNGSFSYLGFANNQVKTKQRVNTTGVNDPMGGDISTLVFKRDRSIPGHPQSALQSFL